MLKPTDRIDRTLYQEYLQRFKNLISSAGGSTFSMTSVSNLAIGLGGKGTLEMGITLRRNAGFPWIPGSALKGLARTTALLWLAEQWGIPAVSNEEFETRKNHNPPIPTPLQIFELCFEIAIEPPKTPPDPHRLDKLEELLNKLKRDPLVTSLNGSIMQADAVHVDQYQDFNQIRKIFGNQGEAGEVIFYGAMTEEPPKIVPDITTPHYKKCYQVTSYPTDNLKPEPIPFLAVERGQSFVFGIGPRNTTTPANLVDRAVKFLKYGLINYGIGAKTSSGLGVFMENPL